MFLKDDKTMVSLANGVIVQPLFEFLSVYYITGYFEMFDKGGEGKKRE